MAIVDLAAFQLNLDSRFTVNSVAFTGPAAPAPGLERMPSASDEYRPSLLITTSEMPITLDNLAQYVGNQLAEIKMLPEYRHIEMETIELTDGTPAIFEHHTYKDEDVLVEQYQTYVALPNGRALIATATHLAGEPFDQWASTFRSILLSITPTAAQK